MRVAAVLTLLLIACGDDDAPAPATAEPVEETPAPRPRLAAPAPAAGPGAFDLALGDEGVLWFVGGPGSRGGGIQVRSLGALGEPTGPWRVVTAGESGRPGLSPSAIAIEAHVAQGRLGVAYVERDQLEVTTRSLLGDGAGRSFGDPTALDTRPFDASAGARGQLAIAPSDAGLSLLHRRTDGPCESGGATDCARFAHARLGEGVPTRGIGWSLPRACPHPLVGAAVAGDIRYHALCAIEEGEPRTTVFAIQYEPQYAHAETLLAGCDPVGLSPFGGGVAVTADCPSPPARRGFLITEAARTVRPIGAPSVSCVEGSPVIAWGADRETLDAPRAGLAPLLPQTLASADDRAVWTGEAIIVATHQGREAVLRRYACDRGTFRRTDP